MLIAPATANTLGKLAHGIADNFLVTAYLSAKCPVMIAPAMDLDMFQHPTTQQNLKVLSGFGNIIIDAQVGELASGLSGPGRMEEPENILKRITDFFFQQQELKGKRILVTAGPTYEKIDPVRFIGNHSSGKMGFSLAEEAAGRGGEVVLIAGPTALQTSHPSIKRIDVTTASEMLTACQDQISQTDILLMAAAVADFTVAEPFAGKMKKSREQLSLTLSPTADILQELGKSKRSGQYFIGFALETDDALENATKKLHTKALDLIVLNSLKDTGAGFGVDTNKVTIISSSGEAIGGTLKSKREVAADIVDAIVGLLNTKK